jgi:hypothetical protein
VLASFHPFFTCYSIHSISLFFIQNSFYWSQENRFRLGDLIALAVSAITTLLIIRHIKTHNNLWVTSLASLPTWLNLHAGRRLLVPIISLMIPPHGARSPPSPFMALTKLKQSVSTCTGLQTHSTTSRTLSRQALASASSSEPQWLRDVTPRITKTLKKVINKWLGVVTRLNQKVNFKNKVSDSNYREISPNFIFEWNSKFWSFFGKNLFFLAIRCNKNHTSQISSKSKVLKNFGEFLSKFNL